MTLTQLSLCLALGALGGGCAQDAAAELPTETLGVRAASRMVTFTFYRAAAVPWSDHSCADATRASLPEANVDVVGPNGKNVYRTSSVGTVALQLVSGDYTITLPSGAPLYYDTGSRAGVYSMDASPVGNVYTWDENYYTLDGACPALDEKTEAGIRDPDLGPMVAY